MKLVPQDMTGPWPQSICTPIGQAPDMYFDGGLTTSEGVLGLARNSYASSVLILRDADLCQEPVSDFPDMFIVALHHFSRIFVADDIRGECRGFITGCIYGIKRIVRRFDEKTYLPVSEIGAGIGSIVIHWGGFDKDGLASKYPMDKIFDGEKFNLF